MSEKKIKFDIETSSLDGSYFNFIVEPNSGNRLFSPLPINHSKIMFINKEISDEITKRGCVIHDMVEKVMTAGIDVSKYKSKKRK